MNWLEGGAAALAFVAATGAAAGAGADPPTALQRCLAGRDLPRVARVVSPVGRPVWVRVVADAQGLPGAVVPIASADGDLAAVFERAGRPGVEADAAPWRIAEPELSARVCSPLPLPQAAIDAEQRVVVAAGLNYAAHAEEAGGGDVFLFPKPVSPTPPYGVLPVPAGVTLLDYEVELAFVLLADVVLGELPSREAFLAGAAFFVANDVTDREPILREKALVGPGTGFVEAKGQPGFLPAGPWLVRGTELFAALEACGAEGLGIRLEVDEGDGFRTRQDADTRLMILDPDELLGRIAEEVGNAGLRTPMPVLRGGATRHYPLAVDAESPRLPAGSVVVTGTPEGVALRVGSPLALLGRALLRLRSPFEQLRLEEIARAASGVPGGYLAPGDRVRAGIDGLGTQVVRIAEPGAPSPPDPCAP